MRITIQYLRHKAKLLPANIFIQLLILKKNTEAIQRKNRASYLKKDNLK